MAVAIWLICLAVVLNFTRLFILNIMRTKLATELTEATTTQVTTAEPVPTLQLVGAEEEEKKASTTMEDVLPFPFAPAKKEDFSPEVVEGIEKSIKEKHPEFSDFKISFVGDMKPEDIPPQLISELDQEAAACRDSLVNGTCRDCGKKIPGIWPPSELEQWPIGWATYDKPGTDEPAFIICPECSAAEDAESESIA